MRKGTLRVFVSYAHKDELLRSALDAHLSALVARGVIAVWHDRSIEAGAEWDAEIQQRLEAADIVLLLVSSDFLASPYCYGQEMKRALERHEQNLARVVPVILRHVDWHSTPFAKLQALPKDGRPITSWANQDEAFSNVAHGLRAVAESILFGKDCVEGAEHFPTPQPRAEPGESDPVGRGLRLTMTRLDRETITVIVRLLSFGTSTHCEIPVDASVESIIIELTARLKVPCIEIAGNPVTWDLESKHLGHLLDPRKTLRENNVRDGDTLTFVRMCTAG